jgi:hypothetical protein
MFDPPDKGRAAITDPPVWTIAIDPDAKPVNAAEVDRALVDLLLAVDEKEQRGRNHAPRGSQPKT